MGGSPEVIKGGTETTVEAQNAAGERSAELAKNRAENGIESSPESQAEALEKARGDAKEALMSKEQGGAEKRGGGEPTASGVRRMTKKQKDAEYKKTLHSLQTQMSGPSRTFSKIIHNPVIEKTSDTVGNTLARPNAILAGSTTAFITVAIVYFIAKHYGYTLSGFESIGAFVLGWLFGICLDYIQILVRGGSNK